MPPDRRHMSGAVDHGNDSWILRVGCEVCREHLQEVPVTIIDEDLFESLDIIAHENVVSIRQICDFHAAGEELAKVPETLSDDHTVIRPLDAPLFAPFFAPIETLDLINLANYEAYVRIMVDGHRTKTFSMRSVPPNLAQTSSYFRL